MRTLLLSSLFCSLSSLLVNYVCCNIHMRVESALSYTRTHSSKHACLYNNASQYTCSNQAHIDSRIDATHICMHACDTRVTFFFSFLSFVTTRTVEQHQGEQTTTHVSSNNSSSKDLKGQKHTMLNMDRAAAMITLIVVALTSSCTASLVYLFDKPHFYEISLKQVTFPYRVPSTFAAIGSYTSAPFA